MGRRAWFAGFAALGIVAIAGCGDNTPISFDRPAGNGGDTSTSNASWCSGTSGSVGKSGGSLDCLSFAVVGDTRPATVNDTASYPSAIVGRIWQDVQNEDPRPAFALTTGDYIFATPSSSEAAPQLDKYLQAQVAYSGTVFHAMGNHECTGYTSSNCASASSSNHDYAAFLSKMMDGGKPYYSFKVAAKDGSWTAKFVVIAANAWDSAQATWLDQALSESTTYTFVVRHEPASANTAPGVTPSGQILAHHPVTMLLVGHTHTFEWLPSSKEMVIGLGGAQLTGSIDYGYVVARQRTDHAMQFAVYDYKTHALIKSFAVDPSGHEVGTISGSPSPTPTPTHTATPTPSPAGTPQELVTNGTFESSLSGWSLGGVKTPIDSSAEAHSGAKSLRCGATSYAGQTEPNGDSWAEQSIAIPASATQATLSFWYFAKSDDPQNDWQDASVRDASGNVLVPIFHGGDDSQAWTGKTVDLSAYAGRTVVLHFDVHSDGGTTPTTLWVDDVSLVAQ